jgi:hypothetical protein
LGATADNAPHTHFVAPNYTPHPYA